MTAPLSKLLSSWCSKTNDALSTPFSARALVGEHEYSLSLATDGHALVAAVFGPNAARLSHAELVGILGTRATNRTEGSPTYWVPIKPVCERKPAAMFSFNAELLSRVGDVQRYLAARTREHLRQCLKSAKVGLTPKAARSDRVVMEVERELQRIADGAEPALSVWSFGDSLDPVYFSVQPFASAYAETNVAFVGAIMPCRM